MASGSDDANEGTSTVPGDKNDSDDDHSVIQTHDGIADEPKRTQRSISVSMPQPASTPASPPPAPSRKRKRRKLNLKLVLVVALIAAIGLMVGFGPRPHLHKSATIDTSKYQAVFLVNGQVYFGKLERVDNDYMKLTGVYYLQATQATADNTTTNNPQQTNNTQTPDIQLIKLGSEVHGPDDEMVISEKQILFFENLKKDGKVSASIDNYQSQKK